MEWQLNVDSEEVEQDTPLLFAADNEVLVTVIAVLCKNVRNWKKFREQNLTKQACEISHCEPTCELSHNLESVNHCETHFRSLRNF